MRRYELTYIIDPDVSEDVRKQIFEKTRNLIEKEKGLIVEFTEWGQKKLAYIIRKKARGYYIYMDYCGESALADELERFLRLDDSVLKYMTVVLDKAVDMDAVTAEIERRKTSKTETKVNDLDDAPSAAGADTEEDEQLIDDEEEE